jgi:UDP-glucose 4-epimerase
MNVLVTGGAGFLGTHVCRALASAGHAVTCVDLVRCRDPRVAGEIGSVTAPEERWFRGRDAVIHLAAVLGVARTERNRRMTLEINIAGTRNVSDACDQAGVRHLVYASSSEVYGDAEETPTPESAALQPQSVYAVAKLAGEEYVRSGRTPWTIVRPFNAYGPGQREDFVVARFIRQALAGEPLTIYGDGFQTRAFCHAADLARAFVAVVENPAARGPIFNLGNGAEPVTMRELARRVIAETEGTTSRCVEGAPDRSPSREIRARCPDISRARAILGWTPRIDLDHGLRETIAAERAGRPLAHSAVG